MKNIVLPFTIFLLFFQGTFAQAHNFQFPNSQINNNIILPDIPEQVAQYPCHKREDQYYWNNNAWEYSRTFFRTFDSLLLIREIVDTVNNIKLYNDTLFYFSGNYSGYTTYHCPWNGIQFEYQSMEVHQDDSIGRPIFDSYSNWNGSAWVLSNKDTVMRIFSGGNVIEEEHLNFISGSWRPYYKYIYTYNLNSELIEEAYSYYDTITLAYNLNFTKTYYGWYNYSLRMPNSFTFSGGFPTQLFSFTYGNLYNIIDNPTEMVEQIYDSANATYNNYERVTSTYKDSCRLSSNFIDEHWNSVTGWYQFGGGISSYTTADSTICGSEIYSFIHQNYDSVTATYINSYRSDYTSDCSFIGVDEIKSNSLSVFPNPVQDELNVNLNTSGKKTILICDTEGRILKTQEFSGNCRINIESLKCGIFFVSILGSDFILYKKIVKL